MLDYRRFVLAMLVMGFATISVGGEDVKPADGARRDGARKASPEKNAADKGTATKDVVDTAIAAGQFKTLVAAIKAADLVETLKGKGPFTVFAPNDAAFSKLPEGTIEKLLLPENEKQLVALLTYHVVQGKVMAADVAKLETAKTVEGSAVAIKVQGKAVMIDKAKVLTADIETSNGVIHVIDTVLMPPKSN